MKNRNVRITAMLFALVFALALSTQAAPRLDGGPTRIANDGSDNLGLPMFTIRSTGDVNRGKTGYFVIGTANDSAANGRVRGAYIKFSVSGSATAGVDYVALVSPTYVGDSGYAVIPIKTLADPRGSFNRQSYSVEITLESAPGYAITEPASAKMLIKP